MSKSDDVDFASFYRNAMGDSLYAAICGLGETGTAEDADVIFPLTSHSTAKIRKVSIQAIGKLDGDAFINLFLDALTDNAPSISHTARDSLRAKSSLLQPDLLWQLFKKGSHRHTQLDVLTLIAGLPKWESIPFLIRACSASNESVAASAQERVQRWIWRYNRSFSQPTERQLSLLSEALEETKAALDYKVFEDFWHLVSGWRKV